MSDTTDNLILSQAVNNSDFQNRCLLRFIAAAISVTTEVGTTLNHTNRLAFAGAIFNGTVSPQTLCMLILANPTVRASVIADPTKSGGNALDNDIDFQIASVFTGVATSRVW